MSKRKSNDSCFSDNSKRFKTSSDDQEQTEDDLGRHNRKDIDNIQKDDDHFDDHEETYFFEKDDGTDNEETVEYDFQEVEIDGYYEVGEYLIVVNDVFLENNQVEDNNGMLGEYVNVADVQDHDEVEDHLNTDDEAFYEYDDERDQEYDSDVTVEVVDYHYEEVVDGYQADDEAFYENFETQEDNDGTRQDDYFYGAHVVDEHPKTDDIEGEMEYTSCQFEDSWRSPSNLEEYLEEEDFAGKEQEAIGQVKQTRENIHSGS